MIPYPWPRGLWWFFVKHPGMETLVLGKDSDGRVRFATLKSTFLARIDANVKAEKAA